MRIDDSPGALLLMIHLLSPCQQLIPPLNRRPLHQIRAGSAHFPLDGLHKLTTQANPPDKHNHPCAPQPQPQPQPIESFRMPLASAYAPSIAPSEPSRSRTPAMSPPTRNHHCLNAIQRASDKRVSHLETPQASIPALSTRVSGMEKL